MDSILRISKNLGIRHNVCIRVIDEGTGKIVASHNGHNAATNSLLTGIAHYLTGDGILNQGYPMLSAYVPKYISLGTMGLINQDADSDGLPAGLGVVDGSEEERLEDYMLQTPGYGADGYDKNQNNNRKYLGLGPVFADRYDVDVKSQILQLGDLNFDGVIDYRDILLLSDYNCGLVEFTEKQKLVADINKDGKINCEDMSLLRQCVDGEISPENLGTVEYTPTVASTINCELISPSFPRTLISYRDIVPETESELPQTIDVVFSAMISTGALAQFREPDKDYIFITEAGLWSRQGSWDNNGKWTGPNFTEDGDNGLLAGYRIAPPNEANWGMTVDAITDDAAKYYLSQKGNDNPSSSEIENIKPELAEYNRHLLKSNILRVGINQVVQVIWKIQLGAMDQLGGINKLYQH